MFDTDTGSTVLIEKVFAPAATEPRLAADTILARPMAPGLPLRGLARGQVLTSVASRRADGTVKLGSGARGKTTLMPHGVLVRPPAPLLVTNLDTLRDDFAARPPAFLQPRNRVANLHVFAIDTVVGQIFEPGAQIWRAAITLPDDGGQLHLQRRYDQGAPAALDALSAAFSGAHGTTRQLAGQVWLEDGTVVCDPWSVASDAFLVPDCDSVAPNAQPQLSPPAASSVGPAAARLFMAGALHAGARRRDGDFQRRGAVLARDLESAGFSTTGLHLTNLLGAPPGDIAAFGRAAVWLTALLER